MRTLAVTQADYLSEYCLKIHFSDGSSQVIDFEPFLLNHPHPQHDKYRRIANFKKFRIERGNLVWGKDWDLMFPVSQLHKGYVAPATY